MNIHSAKSLSMAEILNKIKQTPYPSQDQGIIELVCAYLKEHKQDNTPFDARRWINIMNNREENVLEKQNIYNLIKKYDVIKHPSLLFYLKNQHIPISLARHYLSELKVYNSHQKKHSFVLGFPHEKDGFLIFNPLIEGWIEDPAISFIKGQEQERTSDTIHIFHTFWDYLSLLADLKNKDLQTDTLILNSYDCIPQVKAYLYQYGYRKAYTWMSNDTAGKQATRRLSALLQEEDRIIHIAMNAFYQPFIHLKDWYQQQIQSGQ